MKKLVEWVLAQIRGGNTSYYKECLDLVWAEVFLMECQQ